jgi:hypothetical protein
MYFLGGDQWKAFIQIKAHLVPKHAGGASACAIGLEDTMVVHVAHEIFVLRAYGACCHGLINGFIRELQMHSGSKAKF